MKTMIKISNAVLLISLLSLITGCACYYAPNAQNVPLFSEKGQVNASGSFQFGETTYGFNAQGAVAVSEHMGIMGNYNFFTDADLTTCNTVETGLGYFNNFGQEGGAVFESYGGIGTGRVKVEIDDELQLVNTTSLFIQPDIGYKWDRLAVAFSTRFRYVHFNVTRNDDLSLEYTLFAKGDKFNTGFFEPALTLNAGGKIIRFQFQTMLSFGVGEIIWYDMYNFNFGLVFNIPPKKKQ